LNQRAITALTFWAQEFPNRQASHYVFPSEKAGGGGREDSFGFTGGAVAYERNPLEPIGDIKEAWEAAKKRTRRHCPQCKTGILADNLKPKTGYTCVECHFETADLPAGLVAVRFHDLRHSAVSRMIEAGIPLPKIAKIVGRAPSTMVKMAARYGHFSLDTLRDAVESIASEKGDFEGKSLQFSLQASRSSEENRVN
jgi:hypothetical protein